MKFGHALQIAIEEKRRIRRPNFCYWLFWDGTTLRTVNNENEWDFYPEDLLADDWHIQELLETSDRIYVDYSRKNEVLEILNKWKIPARVYDSKIQVWHTNQWLDVTPGQQIIKEYTADASFFIK